MSDAEELGDVVEADGEVEEVEVALGFPDDVGVEVVVAPVLKATPFCRRWIAPSKLDAVVIESSAKNKTIKESIILDLIIFGGCE